MGWVLDYVQGVTLLKHCLLLKMQMAVRPQ
jgi:hypothetical protein